MPFEPELPSDIAWIFHGHMKTQVTDPHGIPATTIISMTDDWHLQVKWEVHGVFARSICGKWQVRAYLESIGPGPEVLVASRDVDMTGVNEYKYMFIIGPNIPNEPGPYKLVTVITSLDMRGKPAPFAGYDEGPILQFYEAPSLPPSP